MDKFRRMEIFVAVAEAGQLTRAAKGLHLSKSAVSHALTDLEKYLELQLFTRHSGGWQLTAAGSTYYKQCREILADVETMEYKFRQGTQGSQKLSGLIRLSTPGAFGEYAMVPIVAKFMELHPNVLIEFNLAENFTGLLEERVDIAIRDGSLKENKLKTQGLKIQTIFQMKPGIYASPKYLKDFGAPTSHFDLKNHKCIRYMRNPLWRFSKDGQYFEFRPQDHLMMDSGEAVREFCVNGQGLAFMSAALAAFAIQKGRLVEVLTDYDCTTMPVQALTKEKQVPARVTQLIEFIISALNQRQMIAKSSLPKSVIY